jgi:acetylornithine deacetylase
VVRIEFAIQGKAAHSSQPHLGKNAVVAGAHLITAMQIEHERLQTLPSAALGRAALTVTLVHGGTGINVVPDVCTVSLDRRVVDGERASAVVAALHDLAQTKCSLPLRMRVQKEIDAFYQPADSPFIRDLANWTGQPPATAPYGTNAWAYASVTNERVVFGPGSIEQAHGAEEWVEIAELERAAAVYARWWGLGHDDDATKIDTLFQ